MNFNGHILQSRSFVSSLFLWMQWIDAVLTDDSFKPTPLRGPA